MNQDELVQIILTLYGLSDGGDYWHENLRSHLKETTIDFGFYLKSVSNKLVGLATTCVDDVLLASTPEVFEAFKKVLSERFDLNF